ncbi:MAG: nucleoside monophosphate kinase [Bdellovibrionales bacterium]|nr:nucleoside monophosphate kinase [Bdellovibrionales bacterium]
MSRIGVVVLLGPPGSGKGTQARSLSQNHPGWVHISTGDLFRSEIASKSPLGLSVKDILASGKLVSDEVTSQVFKSQVEKMTASGQVKMLLLDGFPRTAVQTEFLCQWASPAGRFGPTIFVEFKISEKTVISRVADRLVNPRNGRVYHRVMNPPKVANIDDEDGQPLIQREDDKPETILARFKLYESQLDGILSTLPRDQHVYSVDAEGAPELVARELETTILRALSD